VFGYAAIFPPKMMGAIMLGQGLSGSICNLIRIICVLILPPSSDPSNNNDFVGCLIYFSLASAILILCVVLFIANEKTEYAKFYLKKTQVAQ